VVFGYKKQCNNESCFAENYMSAWLFCQRDSCQTVALCSLLASGVFLSTVKASENTIIFDKAMV